MSGHYRSQSVVSYRHFKTLASFTRNKPCIICHRAEEPGPHHRDHCLTLTFDINHQPTSRILRSHRTAAGSGWDAAQFWPGSGPDLAWDWPGSGMGLGHIFPTLVQCYFYLFYLFFFNFYLFYIYGMLHAFEKSPFKPARFTSTLSPPPPPHCPTLRVCARSQRVVRRSGGVTLFSGGAPQTLTS